MVAGETQKSYGALDTYAEQNGRQQAKRLREYCAELGQLASKLEHASLLPEGDAERTTWQAEAAAVRVFAHALHFLHSHASPALQLHYNCIR